MEEIKEEKKPVARPLPVELRWNGRKMTSESLKKKLAELEDELCFRVELIDLSYNRLTFVPVELMDSTRFPHLFDLDLSFNQLSHVPTGLGRHRLDGLYTAGNKKLPSEMQRDCHTFEEAGKFMQDVIVANRAKDRAAAKALLIMKANRFDESSTFGPLPRDIVLIIAQCVWSSY